MTNGEFIARQFVEPGTLYGTIYKTIDKDHLTCLGPYRKTF